MNPNNKIPRNKIIHGIVEENINLLYKIEEYFNDEKNIPKNDSGMEFISKSLIKCGDWLSFIKDYQTEIDANSDLAKIRKVIGQVYVKYFYKFYEEDGMGYDESEMTVKLANFDNIDGTLTLYRALDCARNKFLEFLEDDVNSDEDMNFNVIGKMDITIIYWDGELRNFSIPFDDDMNAIIEQSCQKLEINYDNVKAEVNKYIFQNEKMEPDDSTEE